jgi:hypothetical protein
MPACCAVLLLLLLQEDVQSLCWHRVPLHNFHDSPFYGIELRCWVNGVLQEAGFIYLNDGLLAALLVDFFSQADGNLPINFEDPELRKQVGFVSVFCGTVVVCVYVYAGVSTARPCIA